MVPPWVLINQYMFLSDTVKDLIEIGSFYAMFDK